MNIEILYENNTELAEYEALNKGYRNDIMVKKGGKIYKIYVISMLRLQQDFDMELNETGYYMSEPNTILVKTTTKEEIENTIIKMNDCGYFERVDKMGFQ